MSFYTLKFLDVFYSQVPFASLWHYIIAYVEISRQKIKIRYISEREFLVSKETLHSFNWELMLCFSNQSLKISFRLTEQTRLSNKDILSQGFLLPRTHIKIPFYSIPQVEHIYRFPR